MDNIMTNQIKQNEKTEQTKFCSSENMCFKGDSKEEKERLGLISFERLFQGCRAHSMFSGF